MLLLLHLFVLLQAHLCFHLTLTNHAPPLNTNQIRNYQPHHTLLKTQVQEFLWKPTTAYSQPLHYVCLQPYKNIYLRNFSRAQKLTREKQSIHPRIFIIVNLCNEVINNRYCLFSFYYNHLVPNTWQGIVLIPLAVPKIICLSHLHSQCNPLDPGSKIKIIVRIKFYSSKEICSDFGRNILWL